MSEVHEDVSDTEQGRQPRKGVDTALERMLAVDVHVALERHDRVRVRAGRREGRMTLSADELVHAVKGSERGDLHLASSGRGDKATQGGGGSVEMKGRHAHDIEVTGATRPGQYGHPHSRVRPASV
jgi:hypothetical protein